jgi:hypothetical protein
VVLDALSGSIVGLNMLGGMLVWLAARPATVLIRRPGTLSFFAFTTLVAIGYQVGMVALLTAFSSGRHPLQVSHLVLTSVATGVFATAAFPLLNLTLAWLGIIEEEEGLSTKLARRKTERTSWPW